MKMVFSVLQYIKLDFLPLQYPDYMLSIDSISANFISQWMILVQNIANYTVLYATQQLLNRS